MRVLVSGAGGFLGQYVVNRLLECGHNVRAVVRPASAEPKWAGKVEVFRADLRVHDDLVSAFDDIDTVIHLAAATSGSEDVQFTTSVVATERFLSAMTQSAVKRLVHVSSLVVYDWSRINGLMNENSPLLENADGMGAYTIAKVWQERVISKFAKTHSWDLTILRPGFIWGPQHAEIGGMGRHLGRFYLMFGPRTRLPLSHVANCADAIVAAAQCSAAIGQTFNIIDDDSIRVWRYVREYAQRTDQRGIMLPIPYHLGLWTARVASLISSALFGKKGKLPSLLTPRPFEWQFKPIRFSNRKLKQILAWSPPLAFDECLRLTYKSAAVQLPGF